MKKTAVPLFLFLSLFLFPFFSDAQVTGNVTDTTGQAVPFCNVMLIKSSDSTVVTGTTSDESGNFSLEKKDSGNFCLLALYSGYEKYYSASFYLSGNQDKYDAGKIVLKADPKTLSTVDVVAQKPFMQQELDRTVYNIENSIISSGNNALEVLKKLPGVTVDNNDNISVRGKSGVLFLVNGRTSYLSGSDMANYLKSIDASQIEKIEIITNPSAKYDASGNAVINIVLIRNKNLGFNGQITADYGQGFYYESNLGFNANYRMKKWNFFASGDTGPGEFAVTKTYTTIYNSVPEATISAKQRYTNDGLWASGRIGADFMPNDKQTIGFVIEDFGDKMIQDRMDISQMYGANILPDSSVITLSSQHTKMNFKTYSLNYKFDIDSTGRELTADINYAPFSISATRQNDAYYYNDLNQQTKSPTTLKAVLPTNAGILAGKIDYVQPIGKKIKIESGIKSSFVSTDNNAQYYNVIQGSDRIDTNLSNHFLYDEKIYSAYVNYIQALNKKIDFQAGFRGEETQAKGKQLINDSTVARNYFNLFPSAFLNWKIDSTNSLNFSYSRRIDRPDYGELNPFRYFTNPYTYSSGNPYLHPQMSDNYEITYVAFSGAFSTSIGYLHMTDVFANVLHQDDSTHIFFSRNENLNTYNCYNIIFSGTFPIGKRITNVSSLNIFHDHYFGTVTGQDFSAKHVTFFFNTLNTISLGKNWNAEIAFYYRNLNLNAIWFEAPVSGLDIGIKKSFAGGKGTFSLNCSDIFLMNFQNGTAVYQNVNFEVKGHSDSRRLRASLSWKFGKSQYKREDQQKSAEEELNRAK